MVKFDCQYQPFFFYGGQFFLLASSWEDVLELIIIYRVIYLTAPPPKFQYQKENRQSQPFL